MFPFLTRNGFPCIPGLLTGQELFDISRVGSDRLRSNGYQINTGWFGSVRVGSSDPIRHDPTQSK